jgi:hypothetical protein
MALLGAICGDPLERSELITMAWTEGEKLGDRCTRAI